MTPGEIASSYDALAQHWASSKFDSENGIAQHKRALKFLQKKGSAIDIGCGSSGRFIDLLIAEGFDVAGLDLSAEMIRLARVRHPQVDFQHADVCLWEPSKRYQFITAWDSIWHLPLDSQARVLAKLCAALTSDGVIIFSAGGLHGANERRDSQMGVPMYHATIGIPGILRTLHESGCVCMHLEFDQYQELHVYVIAQKSPAT